ncbi:MAG TPA: TonB-dependent receptor [Puia sp.]|nr:TonB-dependent receptor [Puia sp.]
MKVTTFFLLAFMVTANARDGFAQISINEHDTRLTKVFKQLQKQSGYDFLYDYELVKQQGFVSVELHDATLEQAMAACLKDKMLSYTIEEKTVIIRPKKITKPSNPNQDVAPVPILTNRPIKGIVKDENGKPLAGASVMIKGSTIGTVTNERGEFVLDVPDDASFLTISFTGMQTADAAIKGLTRLDISLNYATAQQQDVVVIGYGVQKKIDLTGSVSTVTGDVLNKRPVTDAATMLQGLMPGVDVVQTSGQPGEGSVNIQIRGLGTFSGAGANPLVLIDGIPGDLESIDPNTIESVSVLKDAASASIYGSRAANGVILVTTKTGKNSDGKIRLEYNYNYGIHSPTKMLDLVSNSPDYMNAWNTNIRNSNYGVDIPSREYQAADIAAYTHPSDPKLYPSFNWLKFIIQPAPTTVHNLNLSGGRQTRFNLNLGYSDELGTMRAFTYKRLNAALNIVSDVSKKLTVGANFSLKNGITNADVTGQQNYFLCVLSQPPTIMPTLPDGSGRYSWRAYTFESCNWNPYKKLKEDGSQTKDYTAMAQIWSDLEIIKGLHWNVKAATNYTTSLYTAFTGDNGYELLYRDPTVLGYQYVTSLTKTNTNELYTNVYTYFNYAKKLGLHNLNLMAGYSTEQDDYNLLSGYRNSYASPSTPELDAGAVASQTNNGTSNSWAMQSAFGRLSYNFNEKYLLEANLRYDGTSRLSPDTRWGLFPSFSAGWKFGDESFMDFSRSWLTNAKLRASWGKLGNQNIGLYPYQAMLSLTGVYPFNNSTLSQGVAQTALNNQDIKWETTTTYDIGLDAALFKKFSFSLDLYKKYTADILRGAQTTAVVGLTAPTINSGAMQNTGFDLEMKYRDQIRSGSLKGLNFGGGLVVGAFRNKLVKFGAMQDNGNTIDQEGRPWNTFYLLQTDGIFQSAADVAKSPKQFGQNTQPGMLKYKDVNGDGKIDNADRVPMEKGVFPAFTYGFNLNADYKGFDLFASFQGVAGSKVYVTGWGLQPFIQGTAPTKEQLADAWTPTNHSNTVVELGDPVSFNYPSTYFLKDNSYMRLKTLQFGYTMPLAWIKKFGMTRLRFYFAGDNLLTFTKYPGLDPERAGNGNFVNYPQNKVISFGVNVNF